MKSEQKHILVTGASGFLGRAIVQELLQKNYQVRVLVRSREKTLDLPWSSHVEIFKADLRFHPHLETAFEGIDLLIHAAASKGSDSQEQYDSTVKGTDRLLEAMVKSQTKRLILISSLSVYDFNGISNKLTEESPLEKNLNERDGYAIAKINQEKIVREKCKQYGWDLIVIRPGMLWDGAKEYPQVLSIPLGKIHCVIGPMKAPNLVQVNRCAQAVAAAVNVSEAKGKTFNLVEQNGMNAWDFMGRYLKKAKAGMRIPVPYGLLYFLVRMLYPVLKSVFSDNRRIPSIFIPAHFQARFKPYTCSSERAEKILQWKPQGMEMIDGK